MTGCRSLFAPERAAPRRRRNAFTLFEVILAIALSTVLLALVGAAINLYLTRIEARRVDVEFAQLARSIFSMIRDDLRAASEYKPQSMAGALAAAGGASSFNADSIDSAATGTTGTTGSTSTSGTSTSSGGTSAFGGSTSTSSSSSSSGSTSSGTVDATSMQTTPGVYGTLMELYVDASRPPRLDQLLSRFAGYTNVAVPNLPENGGSSMPRTATGQATRMPMSDLKTVHYFVRSGEEVTDASSIAATTLSPDGQLRLGGLVRQEIDRAARVAAELAGDPAILESGQRLIAPEVVGIEFRYFDGTQVLESWDTKVSGAVPPAIEVRLWLADPNDVHSAQAAAMGALAVRASAREFRQTILLPLAKPAATTATTSGTTGTTGTTGATGTSTGTGGTP